MTQILCSAAVAAALAGAGGAPAARQARLERRAVVR
jgi:hypothetical protein